MGSPTPHIRIGAWSLESGVWSLESGVWSLESGQAERNPILRIPPSSVQCSMNFGRVLSFPRDDMQFHRASPGAMDDVDHRDRRLKHPMTTSFSGLMTPP
ncbi:hypothetical protein FEI13_02460 [Halomonas urmiana]|uniref:Uncharacterized protein n=1 Tax=Halomonas urmiana TaxID=490901 RepID=A0A5R8MLA1_9GAMM|nr:hypothetical protein FEI13_02460 [Halomonas urmiana]